VVYSPGVCDPWRDAPDGIAGTFRYWHAPDAWVRWESDDTRPAVHVDGRTFDGRPIPDALPPGVVSCGECGSPWVADDAAAHPPAGGATCARGHRVDIGHDIVPNLGDGEAVANVAGYVCVRPVWHIMRAAGGDVAVCGWVHPYIDRGTDAGLSAAPGDYGSVTCPGCRAGLAALGLIL
jgi:hypothetical protein